MLKERRIILAINHLYCGDSIELIKNIEDNSISLIASDIPYGISYSQWDVLHSNTNSALGGESKAQKSKSVFKRRGKPLNGWSEADKKIPLEYQQWCASWAPSWLKVLKPGASCFIFAGRRYAHRCIVAMEDAGFTFKDMLSWDRGHAVHRAQRVSSVFNRRHDTKEANIWQGWRLANLRPEFEPILWFQKPYPIGKTITDNILKYQVGAWNENAIKKYNIGNYEPSANIFKVSIDSKSDHGLHETQKPLALMKLLIELSTVEGQTVLDPFMGSGTTCAAAKELNRSFIGIEKEKKYFAIAQKRLEDVTQQTDLF